MTSGTRTKNDLKYQLKKYDLLEEGIADTLLILIPVCLIDYIDDSRSFRKKSKIFSTV